MNFLNALKTIFKIADFIIEINNKLDNLEQKLNDLEVKVSNISGKLEIIEKYLFDGNEKIKSCSKK